MSTEPETSDFERRSKALFDASVEELDGRTLSKLTQARHAALAEIDGSRRKLLRVWIPMGGVAAAVLAAALIFAPQFHGHSARDRSVALDDLDIVASDDEFELIENVEFYSWIDTQLPASDDSSSGEVG